MNIALLKENFWRLYHSPTAFRDVKNLLSGIKIGGVMSLTHGMVLASLSICLLLVVEERDFRELVAYGTLGEVLILSALMGLTVGVALFTPAFMIGLFDGPRWRGYLDQIVVTGISPMQYVSGRIFSGTLVLIMMSLSMLPYLFFSQNLGAIHWIRFVYGVLLIILWGMSLMMLFAAFSIYFHEVVCFFIVAMIALISGGIGLAPFPGAWGALTPVRYLILPLLSSVLQNARGSERELIETLYSSVYLGYWKIPIAIYTPLISILTGFICYRFLQAGPRHRFIPGLNNFGVVVFHGDHRRRGFWRLRWNLKRQVERIFFFENSKLPLNEENKEHYRRQTRFFLITFFTSLFIFGALGGWWTAIPGSGGGFSLRDLMEIRLILFLIGITFYLSFSLRTENEFFPEHKKWHFWDHSLEFVYSYFLPVFLFIFAMATFSFLYDSTHGSVLFLREKKNFDDVMTWILPFLLVFPYSFSLFLFARLLGTFTYSRVLLGIFLMFYVFFSLIVPILCIGVVEELAEVRLKPEAFFPLYPLIPTRHYEFEWTGASCLTAAFFLLFDFFLLREISHRFRVLQKQNVTDVSTKGLAQGSAPTI